MDRSYDKDGYRRVPPTEKHDGLVEYMRPDGRCIQVAGYGPEAEAAIILKNKEINDG